MTPRRRALALFLGLFMLPAIACGSTAGVATSTPKSGAASTATSTKTGNAAASNATPQPTNTTIPTPATSRAYGLNELVSIKNWDLAVQKVETPGKELVWSKFGNKSSAAGTWFIVVLDMKNTGNQNFGINSFDFELKAGSVTYKVSDELGASSYSEFQGGQRIGGQVPPGVNVTYHIPFDVAPNAADLQLTFKQDKRPTFAVGNAFAGNAPPAGGLPSGAPAGAPVAAPPGGGPYGLNQLVSIKNWDLAVQKVERPGKELVWSQFGNKSTATGTWFVIVVDMKNTGNQNFGVNAFDFELKAGSVTYKVSDDLSTYSYSDFKGGHKIGGQVPPGVNVTYYIVFDIAPTASDLQFTFKQDKKPTFAVGNATP